MATQTQFDFDAFNKATRPANSGMKLFLAQQLVADVLSVMVRFENDAVPELSLALKNIKYVREENKKAAAIRAAKQAAREELGVDSSELDNASLPGGANTKASNSADAGKVA